MVFHRVLIHLLILTFFISVKSIAQQSGSNSVIDSFRVVKCSHEGVAADFKKTLTITFNQPIHPNSLK